MATKKKATDIVRKRRLQKIQNIHEQILKGEKLSRFSRLDKVAYILWRYPNTRNSDRTHSDFAKKQLYYFIPSAFLGATSGIIIVLDFINKGINFYIQQICTCH